MVSIMKTKLLSIHRKENMKNIALHSLSGIKYKQNEADLKKTHENEIKAKE